MTVVHPLANPDGVVQTQTYYNQTVDGGPAGGAPFQGRDGRMRRKNMKGVDEDLSTFDDYLLGVNLNRNHAVGFGGPGSSADPTHLNYKGEQPGRESESQALYDAADYARVSGENRLRFYTDFHSYGQLYFVILDG